MGSFLNTVYTTPVASGIELMTDIALNGQVYDKQKFIPKPFNFIPATSTANEFYANSMLFLKNYINNRINNMAVYNNLFVDNKNPNVCYYVRQLPSSSTTQAYLVKVTNNGSSNYEFQETLLVSTSFLCVQYIEQDDNFIYFLRKSATAAIIKFNKNNNTVTSLDVCSVANDIRILTTTQNFIYFAAWRYTTDIVLISRYDKATQTATVLKLMNAAALGIYDASQMVSASQMLNNYWYITVPKNVDGTNKLWLRWFRLEPDTDVVTTDYMDIELPPVYDEIYGKSDMPYSSVITTDIIQETNGDNYLYVTRHLVTDGITYADVTLSKHYTFKLTTETKATLIKQEFFPCWYTGKLMFNNNKSCIFAHSGGYDIYTWDPNKKCMRNSYSASGMPYQIAIDKINNIYVVNTDKTVYREARNRPAGQIEITLVNSEDLRLPIYGELQGQIKVSVTNYIGEYISYPIKITIFGNAKFTDSGEKEKMVITTSNEEYLDDITIFGSGDLTILATPINL